MSGGKAKALPKLFILASRCLSASRSLGVVRSIASLGGHLALLHREDYSVRPRMTRVAVRSRSSAPHPDPVSNEPDFLLEDVPFAL